MKEKKLWVCENCGQEFERYIDCENHEFECMDKIKLYEQNVKNVISRIKQKYGSLISNSKYEIEDKGFICEGDFHNCYHFVINFQLSNGNTVVVNDGMDEDLWLGNYLEEEVIYKSTEREIEKSIFTFFEGIIKWEYVDNWRTDFLGEIEISDIVNRLNGKKVRLEVID